MFKKFTTILLVLIMLFSVSACGDNRDSYPSSSKNQNQSKPQSENFETSLEKKNYPAQYDIIDYWIYTPENATENMPLIVYLHEEMDSGDGKYRVLKSGFPKLLNEGTVSDIPAYVIIPELPEAKTAWADVKISITQLIDFVVRYYEINPEKICLTGHGIGGTGTWDIAIAYPDKFSCIVPMSGTVDCTDANLTALANMPIWAFVGTSDKVFDPAATVTFITEISKTNTSAKLTQLPNALYADVPKAFVTKTDNPIEWMVSNTNKAGK